MVKLLVEVELERTLIALSTRQRLMFLIIVCERVMFELVRFANATNFNYELYRKKLDEVWSYLLSEAKLPGRSTAYQECLHRAPDTEDYDHP